MARAKHRTVLRYMAMGLLFVPSYGMWTRGVAEELSTKQGDPTMGKESESKQPDLKKRLTPLQYHVTQQEGTERPFENEFWDNKAPGIYVDVVSGEPLFSSTDKFDSGTGWPSFSKPLKQENIVERSDHSMLMKRTEVRSDKGGSHLGHLFNDGPTPTGMRYCINSAALRFIPADKLEQEGYGEFNYIFDLSSPKK